VTTSLLGATSSYYNKVMTFDWISKFFVRNQHLWFLPVMAIARINLYVQSLLHIIVNMRGLWRILEFLSMVVYFSWLTCLISALPTYQERVVFFILSHSITAILHIQICVSHFSMETIGAQFSSYGESWAEMQSRTTLDIAHNRFSKWVHGGLDMQLEHHLFPRMARHNLYKVRQLPLACCLPLDCCSTPLAAFPPLAALPRLLRYLACCATSLAACRDLFETGGTQNPGRVEGSWA
jgi:delta8-fatty-acid desaturase